MNPAAAAYENAHVTSLEAQLSRAVDSCMRLRPADPAAYIGVRLISASAVAESPTTPHPPATEAVASEPPAGAVTSEWKAVSWLDSEEVNRELAAAMLGKSFITGGDELAAMRALGGSATLEDELTVRLAAAIGPLVARLAPRLRALATVEAATSGEMQTKFSQECRGMLEYGSLSVFFGGLEGLVGSPNPMVMEAMAGEHSARSDSTRDFTTSNYDLRTTSAVEWAFVATPDQPPEGGWPVEKKIRTALDGGEGADLEAIRASGAQPEPGILTSHAYSPLATDHRPPTTYHLPPTTYHLLTTLASYHRSLVFSTACDGQVQSCAGRCRFLSWRRRWRHR